MKMISHPNADDEMAAFLARYIAAQDDEWRGFLDGGELVDKAIEELIADGFLTDIGGGKFRIGGHGAKAIAN
jgi:hypothetical protein